MKRTVKLKIKQLRTNHPDKPSQRFMGDLLGVTESNYRRLESNLLQSVKFEHLNKLINFFECDFMDLWEVNIVDTRETNA